MFWVDRITENIKKDLKDKISSGSTIIVRDEKTASGRVHVGSMRGVAIHNAVAELLKKEGIKIKFLYEINDFDPMDGLPVYLDKKEYEKYMGLPLYKVPSPDGKAKNFAEYFGQEFIDVIKNTGFEPDDFPRASELYLSGKMNDVIRLSLENADKIRKIYKEVSGSKKDEDWLPISVICESCGKIGTTKTTNFDGEKVTYKCEKNMVSWAEGCGHTGSVSPFDGNAKLPWKVEWAAKFKVYCVSVEGAGKDHSTKGGARDVANRISREVFDFKSPFDIPYEFFLVGGKKMSSSKGEGSSSNEIASLVPAKIFRLSLIGKNPKQTVEFKPDGDTIPLLFDWYDKIAEKKFDGVEDDDTRLLEFIDHKMIGKKEKIFLPRFSQVAFLVQMPHIDIFEYMSEVKGSKLNNIEKEELEERAKYAKQWLELYAPESYVFKIQEKLPTETNKFTDKQKNALKLVLDFIKSNKKLDGQELHAKLHDIRSEIDIEPKDFFASIYISILGKESGPKAGWFLSVLDKDFLEKRLSEVI